MSEVRTMKAIMFSNGGDDEAYDEILSGLKGFGYLVELVEVTATPRKSLDHGRGDGPLNCTNSDHDSCFLAQMEAPRKTLDGDVAMTADGSGLTTTAGYTSEEQADYCKEYCIEGEHHLACARRTEEVED